MDCFSFGMLCLWTLFEKHFSGVVPLPEEASWAEKYLQIGEEHRNQSKHVLASLKLENKLILLAQQLVICEPDLKEEQKQALQQFFEESLVSPPQSKPSDLNRLCNYFRLER